MPKQARLSGIKSFRCYTKAEAAALVGVSTRTIGNWARDGLALLDAAHPPLIRGDDLRDYIVAQRADRKVKTELCEFYCFRCRKGRAPAADMADCRIEGNKAMLTALCDVCEGIICKPVSLVHLPEVRSRLDLTINRTEATFVMVDIRPPVFPLGPLPRIALKSPPTLAVLNLLLRAPIPVRVMQEGWVFFDCQKHGTALPNSMLATKIRIRELPPA